MLDRRDLIRRAGLTALAGLGGGSLAPLRALAGDTATLPFGNGERPWWPIRASALCSR